jgi:hypothetical protein
MEIVLALIALVVVGFIIYVNRESRSLDINKDGKVDLGDAKAAIDNAVSAVKESADQNKDGKIDAQDVKIAAKKTKAVAKKAAGKAKTNVKAAAKKATTRGRKPKA